MENLPPEQQRYFIEAEKRKRQRPEGSDQFQDLEDSKSDRLRHLVDDIWADHAALDALPSPIKGGDHIKFLIVGAGMGGILMAIRLIQEGFTAEQIRIVEAAGGVGGTWYWNRYPGLHCDVESYIYLPLLEETGYIPKQKYSSCVEIRNYLIELVRKWGLADKILYRTSIDGPLRWDESSRTWKVDLITGRGPNGQTKERFSVEADFTFLVNGLFPAPHAPKLPGLDSFKGSMMHTGRWDYSITGGSSETPFPEMDKLKGKRVGIIGTGATAIQVVPELAKYAEQLYVFQRTPSAVHERGQKTTDPAEWRESIAPKDGWQKERMENFAMIMSHSPSLPEGKPNLVGDGWTHLKAYCALVGNESIGPVAPDQIPQHIGKLLALDTESSTKVRARVPEIVKDQKTADALTPWYPAWCKRPTFSDIYLQAFNQPNVHLVDTDGKGIDNVSAKGVVANGQEYPVDVLILGTGYRSPTAGGGNPAKRIGIDIFGRGGRTITDKWDTQGASTLHGVGSNGFPNLFWIYPIQSGVTANFAHNIDTASRHIGHIVARGHERAGGKDKKGVAIEVSEVAEEAWSMRCLAGAAYFAGMATCTPSYLNNEGQVGQGESQAEMMKRARGSPLAHGIVAYIRELEAWRNEGSLDGFEVSAS
ncbi:hypothetical protein V5O48_014461 [Marasmius crinis-equi]|uniref:FAD/NAD(P)-binding domain-containing protein n=1 Tax=Marasmius crinis-equi TaxID=585013 RepID=A0ABR3EX92_9AGAR